MTDNYASFKTFNDKETAEDFSEVLKEYGIEFSIEEDVLEFDPTYANNELDKDYHIIIRQADFDKARKAYEAYFTKQLHNAPPDYYLFSFSDEELKDILAKPDEWGTFDYLLADKILQDRGIAVSETEKQSLKNGTLQSPSGKAKRETHPHCSLLFNLPGLFSYWYFDWMGMGLFQKDLA